MSRPNGLSRAYASVSVIAVFGLLSACSQPATYATVDLGGSYAGDAPQAYSAASGLPVYRSTQGYTTPSYTGVPAPTQNQLVYLDAPTNQVASLAPSYNNGGYSEPTQQSYPDFGTVVRGETLTDQTILRSDGFIDIGDYADTRTASLAPGAGSISLDAMNVAPQYTTAPQAAPIPQYTPAPQNFAAPQYVPAPPAMVDAAPMATPLPAYDEPLTVIQSAPTPAPAPLAAPIAAEPLAPVAPPVSVSTDYTAIATDILPAPVAPAMVDAGDDLSSFSYAPIAPRIESTPLDLMNSPAQDFAGLQPPVRDDVNQVANYYDLRDEKIDGTVQQAALPTAIPSAPAPATPILRTSPAPAANYGGSGLRRPVASSEYLRPYEALPPGFFPPYDFGPAGDALSQAPVSTLTPQFVAAQSFAPVEAPIAEYQPFADAQVDQASVATFINDGGMNLSYTVQPGDTLYGIARTHGSTPDAIAQTNGIGTNGIIYPGNTLDIPNADIAGGPDTLGDAPIVVLKTAEADIEEATSSTYTRDMTDQSVEMIDLAELAKMYTGRESGGGIMPIISAETGNALRGRVDLTPTEVISNPRGSLSSSVPYYQATPSPAAAPYVPEPMPIARTSAGYAWPVHGDVYRLASGQIDIAAPFGASVSAAAPGRVVSIENGSRGTLIVIEHDDGWRSLTLGLAASNVTIGQRVMEGTFLGTAGMDRIRFELRDGDAKIAETLGILRS